MRILTAVLLIICFPTALFADVVFTTETTEGGTVTNKGKMYISGKKMKMNNANKQGQQQIIFRGDGDYMITVIPEQKTYVQFGKSDISKMSNKVNDAMKELEKQFAGMDPKQVEMMKKMMSGMAEGLNAQQPKKPAPVVKRTGETHTISGYPCVKYLVTRGGELTREYWVAAPSAVAGGEEAQAAFEYMGEFFSEIVEEFSQGPFAQAFDNPYTEFSQIKGIPIKTVEYEKGKVVRQTVISNVAKEQLALATFEPPANYTRQQGPW